jgi:cold shock CspA family protein
MTSAGSPANNTSPMRVMTPNGGLTPMSPLPEGYHLPELIITRRTRTLSMSGRIENEVNTGTVRFFCRSKGHGFIDPDDACDPFFMHITDIEGEFIPRRGDKVTFRLCPMPPKFQRYQAVCIHITDFTTETHHKWSEKETPEEFEEDAIAMLEEARMNHHTTLPTVVDI